MVSGGHFRQRKRAKNGNCRKEGGSIRMAVMKCTISVGSGVGCGIFFGAIICNYIYFLVCILYSV